MAEHDEATIYRVVHRTPEGREFVVDDGWYGRDDALQYMLEHMEEYDGKLVLQQYGWTDIPLRWIPPTEGRFEFVD